jgi:GNAT superfamily N-acetyltransferase
VGGASAVNAAAAILAAMPKIERARAEHLDGVRAIAASYGNLDDWAGRPDVLDFELRERALWVALDGGAVVAYAGVVRHGDVSHLADLFVARDRLGAGIGRRLLDTALPRDGVRITFASRDERALPLYVRAGLRPLAPLLYLERTAPPCQATHMAGFDAAVKRVAVAEIAARDAAASARERPELLGFLAEAGAYALSAERPGAYAVVRPAPVGAWLGPAAAHAGELLAFAAAATAAHGGVRLALGGPHPALARLLECGFQIRGADTYMTSHPDALDIQTYLPEPDLG